jgi:hypothetical protein
MKKKKWISAADEFANQINTLKQNISPGALTRLRNLQPFDLTEDARNENPLWILSELDNIYKHRLLHLVVYKLITYTATLTSGEKSIPVRFEPNVRFKNGAEIGRIEITDVIKSLHVCDHIFVVTATSRGPGILASIPMAKVTETREPSKRPRCPHCGDARIALMKASDPHGRNVWWLTCHVCGHMWQPVVSSIPARAGVCD